MEPATATSPAPGATGEDGAAGEGEDGGATESVSARVSNAGDARVTTPAGDAAEAEVEAPAMSGGAALEGLPDEYNQSDSAVEGMRVLQCIEWLRDMIIEGKFGDEETEMVNPSSPRPAQLFVTFFLGPCPLGRFPGAPPPQYDAKREVRAKWWRGADSGACAGRRRAARGSEVPDE